ncbi:MAG: UbiD family decarboxylase [Chloroflexota bacterium]
MIYRDLREWIGHLEKEGELVRLKEEINLEPDVGAIGRAICDIEGPAVLAENIVGFTDTGRLATGLTATQQRIGMALGLAKDAPMKEQKRAWLTGYKRYPIKARMVKDAPCKENIVRGEGVNLFDFPIPRSNPHDAGPFLFKTSVITKDPDSDWINSGTYRMQVLDRNKTTMYCNPHKHWGQHYERCRELGKDMECAVAFGTEPVINMASGMKIPRGWNEFDMAGALREEPEELIMAESVALPVPAPAEMILEGVISLTERAFEGGCGEATGASSGAVILPVFQVNTITYRSNPIFDTLYMGRPPEESASAYRTMNSAMLEQELKAIFPQVTEVAFLWPGTRNVVIQGKWGHRGEPRKAIAAFFGSLNAAYDAKIVTIVDEDIDPWNVTDVMWAIVSRAQANKDYVIIPGCKTDLDPSAGLDDTSCWLGIDATKAKPPYDRIVADWVVPPPGTEFWREKLRKLARRGR